MRAVVSRLAVAGLVLGQTVLGSAAWAQCAKPVDKSAFDVAGLKSQLMVTALTCDVRDKYNAFVARYQRDLMSGEKALVGYFGRAFGRRGQKEHDDYITSLANAQSETGIKQGTLFCTHSVGLFDEVMGLPQGADLAGFASTKGLVQPVNLVVCGPSAPVPTTRTASLSTRRTTASR